MASNRSSKACAQSFSKLCDPMNCSAPGSSVHEIFLARVLEWIAISFSGGKKKISWLSGKESVCNAGEAGSIPE